MSRSADRVPSWDFPRTPAASRHLLETAAARGVDAAVCLAGTGLTNADLADPACQVAANQELAIVRNLLTHVPDHDGLGVDAGLRYTLASTGILGYALLTSTTLRDALSVALRYMALSSAFVDFDANESRAGLEFELDASQIPEDVRAFLLERDLAALANLAPMLVGAVPSQRPTGYEAVAPGLPADLLRSAGLEYTVRRPGLRVAITVPHELLDQPMRAADPATAASCIAQCEELLDRRTQRGGLSAQVRVTLIRNPAAMPPMAAVARTLALTTRTLHRRLAAEGTSYRALVDEVRETLAVELLGNGLTVEQVAHRLGFSETAAFTHAFTRWRGYPPSRSKSV